MFRTGQTSRLMHAVSVVSCLSAGCDLREQSANTDGQTEISEYSDLLQSATEHGELAFPSWTPGQISPSEASHAWTFELTDTASVTLRTEASSEGEVDTVLSLYREGPRGYGRAIARNDDTSNSVLSALNRRLKAGRYRVLVKGNDASAVGTFILASECRGAGCPKVAPECLFGSTFYELLHGEGRRVEIASEEQITSGTQVDDALSSAQLLLAVQQSSHTDVTTAEEALSRVDQGTVRRLSLFDPAAAQSYTVYEYGAGDNSYGAIFVQGTLDIAARIHDGDFLDCAAHAAACVLPSTYSDLRASSEFEVSASVVLTASALGSLPRAARAQLLTTLRLTYPEVDAPTLEAAISLADRGEVRQLRLRERATGRVIVVYEHGAGDTSVGALFEADEPAVRATISDGAIEDCNVFAP